MEDCPCGTGFPYTDCCGPLIRGASPADTAEDLMRSRFSAFAKGLWSYLEQTRYPDGQELSAWYKTKFMHDEISWTKLDILDAKKGDSCDEEGEVSFIAHYVENGEQKTLQEVSRFIKEEGKWFYNEHESKIISSAPPPRQKRSLEINLKWVVMLRVPAGVTKNIKNVVVRGSFPHLF